MDSGTEQADDGAELHRVVAGVLLVDMVLALIPQLGIERRLGVAERHVRVAPQRVDAAWVVVAGVWPGGLGVDQVSDDGALRGKIAGLSGHEAPLGLHVTLGVGSRRTVGLRIVHVVAPHTAAIAHGPGHLGALVIL